MGKLALLFEQLSFTAKYITALTLIALLSTLAFFNLNHLISSQANDGQLITVSGQQIMLSQKIALYAIYYQTKRLEVSIGEIEENHSFLINEPMSSRMKDIYYSAPINLDEKVKTFITHAKRFQLTRDGKSLTYVLQNSQKLLEQLGHAAQAYLEEAEAKTQNLKKVESYIYFMTIGALLLEALFIFRPANASINRKARELTREKDYSNAVIESSTNAIVALDYDYRIQTYNKTAEKIFGYSRLEMKSVEDLLKITPRHYTKIHAMGAESFLNKYLPINIGEIYELEACDSDNNHFPIRISFGTSEQGSVAIVANIQDITKEKLNNTLMHKQAKFAALGEMIAIIAHQWRQPLAELSFNNMYLKKLIKETELRDELVKNEGIIQFMSETISSFESFYARSPHQEFARKDSISQALKSVESLFKLRGIKLKLELEEVPFLYGHQNGLSQVMLSLLQNSISIHKINNRPDPWIKIGLKSTASAIVITVCDNGGGIVSSPIERIFEPFHSDRKSPSTGLGLYMSRLVIEEKFNGTISAENLEEGACFSLVIPINQCDNLTC
ncbi:MAG: PAS domain S-box protein [Campylobacteraceae bacterium]|nr:PAS domain S-box protein [Campylobacteraceae bacterium]